MIRLSEAVNESERGLILFIIELFHAQKVWISDKT